MKLKNVTPSFIEYHALRGSYGRVTYFITKTSLRDVAENLTLAPQATLSFSERIQRLVNTKRVEEEIVPYLKENELRFFNALICILLPDNDELQGFWDFDDYKDENGHSIDGLGKLKITKDVARVVLDGQHRFSALELLWKSKRHDTTDPSLAIEVALVFVVVDEIGKTTHPQKGLRTKTIGAVRNLFAVLNKTARSVDKTTLLLIDDSDILNVMTRSLVEQKLVAELYVKWTGGENLQPTDPYFTVITVLKDAISFYLRDYADALDIECGAEPERQKLMRTYYDSTPGFEVAVKEAIPFVFQNTSPFGQWKSLLQKHAIQITQQPDSTQVTRSQGKLLEKARSENLCFTVAGQKMFFRSIIDVFKQQRRRDIKALRSVAKNAEILFNNGLLSRKYESNNPFGDLLFDAKGRMFWAEGPVDCARKIFAIALGSTANRQAVMQEYNGRTDKNADVIKEYWQRSERLLQ
ncbi:MAG: DGQHR domain-containing protein [Deltaproteobacteria bacterium]|nr:DGQHR domain-containing protein [Deltaproteobacteria bacterium]